MTFGPVVSSSGLSKHKVIGPKDLAIRPRPHTVHGPGLQIHEHSTGYIPSTTGFIVVDIDTLQLQIGDSLISSSRVDSVLLAHHLPELGTDLVPALPSLDMQNLTHLDKRREARYSPAAAKAATDARRNGTSAREKREKEEEAGRQARTTGGGHEDSAWNRNKYQRRESCTDSRTVGAWFGSENLAIW